MGGEEALAIEVGVGGGCGAADVMAVLIVIDVGAAEGCLLRACSGIGGGLRGRAVGDCGCC